MTRVGSRDVYASLVQKETCIVILNSSDDSNLRDSTNNCASPRDTCEKVRVKWIRFIISMRFYGDYYSIDTFIKFVLNDLWNTYYE